MKFSNEVKIVEIRMQIRSSTELGQEHPLTFEGLSYHVGYRQRGEKSRKSVQGKGIGSEVKEDTMEQLHVETVP